MDARIAVSVRIMAILTLLVVGGIAAPAPAPDAGSACGKTDPDDPWRRSHICHFWFRGLPIVVQGDAIGKDGATQLRVWVSPLEDPTVPLVECTATDTDGSGFARCSNGVPDETSQWPEYGGARAVLLYCNVEGARRGTYLCVSGFGA